ncbi:DUF4279 domain-containing protein [Amycolatopsis rhabdoformis]|uniref:DUF4279 domain-containing protein n=1 Tax=Amycolatopsis rhabdoformis TaxID=1448059 RepID=A0ABZ1HUG0_9PSEU|nr:DUF4279 domain-containing protein [Amycolatopsis rhabdoformis]WSE26026.1 DUF4279 domain-containing protein [Amycolatopsis rhabdoformis]
MPEPNSVVTTKIVRDDGEVQTSATFRLGGDRGASARAVTDLLELAPTFAAEAGERVGRRSSAVRATALWSLTSPVGDEAELSDHLTWLLDRLEPKTGELWQLADRGYSADWFCAAASHAAEHAVELDRALLVRLVALPGPLLIDVAGDDPERDFSGE